LWPCIKPAPQVSHPCFDLDMSIFLDNHPQC
jgi:hypothetical protein